MFKRIFALILWAGGFFSVPAFSEIVQTQHLNDKVYFLSSSPNQIRVYDLQAEAFEESIALSATPTGFFVSENDIYLGYGRVLKRLKMSDMSEQFIRNTVADIKHIQASSEFLFISDATNSLTTLTLDELSYVANKNSNSSSSYKYLQYVPNQNALYGLDDDGSVKKVVLDKDGKVAGYRNKYFRDGVTAFTVNPFENMLFTSSGKRVLASDLSPLPAGPSFDKATFAEAHLATCQSGVFTLYSRVFQPLKETELIKSCDLLIYYNGAITVFELDRVSGIISNERIELLDQELDLAGTPFDPDQLAYQYELLHVGEDQVVYIYDQELLHVHRWSLVNEKYLKSIVVKTPLKSIELDNKSGRLYFGFDDGEVHYVSTKSESFESKLFIQANDPVHGIEIRNNVFVINAGYRVSSWSSDGNLLGSFYGYNPQELVLSELADELTVVLSNQIFKVPVNKDGSFGNNRTLSLNGSQPNMVVLDSEQAKVIYQNGRIFSSDTAEEIGLLSSDIQGAAWLNDELVTIRSGAPAVQFWTDQFELDSSIPLPAAYSAEVFNVNDELVLIQQKQSVEIDKFDLKAMNDKDSDGKTDLEDNCKTISNPDQLDTDGDYLGDECDLDDDNDGLPDTVEAAVGLNSLDSADAFLDLDQDGFINIIEYAQQSDVMDNTSTPAMYTEYFANLNTTIPKAFIVQDQNDWKYRNDLNDGRFYADKMFDIGDTSSLYFIGYFDTGFLEFDTNDYLRHEAFDVYLNAEKVTLNSAGHHNDFARYRIPFSKGSQVVEFRATKTKLQQYAEVRYIDNIRFYRDSDHDGIGDSADNCPNISNRWQHDSDEDGIGNECDNTPHGRDRDDDDVGDWEDNCPDVYNPDQANVDHDLLGDACDDVDDRPQDHDGDGLVGYEDNCPLVANPNQEDLDLDSHGDVCDSDIDGDGISNEVEDQYIGLNPYDREDAYQDSDGDGAYNLWEIQQGNNPDTYDAYPEINLFDYYPLGDIEYVYSSGNFTLEISIESTDTNNQFIITYQNTYQEVVEKREDGLYLISKQRSNDPTDVTICENVLIMPAKLKKGGFIKHEGFCHESSEGNKINVTSEFVLVDIGSTQWQGVDYSSIELLTNTHYSPKQLLTGIGEISFSNLELTEFNVDHLDRTYTSDSEPTSGSDSDDSSGIGSTSIGLFSLLALLATRRRGKSQVKSLRL